LDLETKTSVQNVTFRFAELAVSAIQVSAFQKVKENGACDAALPNHVAARLWLSVISLGEGVTASVQAVNKTRKIRQGEISARYFWCRRRQSGRRKLGMSFVEPLLECS